MPLEKVLPTQPFLEADGLIIDVRSSTEYNLGHIPEAINMPLFTDEEREQVGLVYKTQGFHHSMELGLKYCGPKLFHFLREVREKKSPIKVYCSGGGMRSQSLLWLFNFSRLPAVSLRRGYKSYRNYISDFFSKNIYFKCLGGFAGAGKTKTLKQLKKREEQVLDLRALASYEGSLFGSLKTFQPTSEQFENILASQLMKMDLNKPIWVEGDLKFIGSCTVPNALFENIKASPLYLLQEEKEKRIATLLEDYIETPIESLIDNVKNMRKKMGIFETRKVVNSLERKELREAVETLVNYHDKTYAQALKKRTGNVVPVSLDHLLN